MTPRQIAALAIRIFALYCVISSLWKFPQCFLVAAYVFHLVDAPSGGFFGTPNYNYNDWSIVLSALPGLFDLGFGVMLWVFAEGLAIFMVEKNIASTENVVGVKLDSYALHVIVYSTVGLLFVLKGLPIIAQMLLEIFLAAHNASAPTLSLEAPQILAAIVQIPIGIWLIFGSKGFVKRIRSAREMGRDPAFVDEPQS